MKWLISLAVVTLLSMPAWSSEVSLKKDYPERYVVVKGDTLWDIAGKFLQKPWEWPQIWNKNPQIKNPNLIYPGNVLRLIFIEGKPTLVVDNTQYARGNSSGEIFSEAADVRDRLPGTAVPMVPLSKVKQFLNENRMIKKGTRESAPYVLGIEDGRVLAGKGDKIYARGNFSGERGYSVFRLGKTLHDPQTGLEVGEEAQHIADVRVLSYRDEVTELLIESSNQEVHKMDFLLPRRNPLEYGSYLPSAPDRFVKGQIIAVADSVSQAGRWNVVTLNVGFNDGLRPGNVLAVHKKAEHVFDPKRKDTVSMPIARIGEVIIFRVYEAFSYALVVRINDVVEVKDYVSNP